MAHIPNGDLKTWLMFIMCRIVGPYPFLSANIPKLFADAQVFVVALVGLG